MFEAALLCVSVLSRLRSPENVVDIGPFFRLEIEVKSIEPLFQIIEIKISEFEHAVRHADPQRWSAWAKRGLADKVALCFQDTSDLSDSLILIAKQLQCATAGNRIKGLGFERQRQRASTHVVDIAQPLFGGEPHGALQHLRREIKSDNE